MSPLRIIGIDPGFDRLGIAIIDKEGVRETLVYSTCIITTRTDSFEDRLTYIGKELTSILTQYQPHDVAIETLFFTKNQKTVITVAEVRGLCIYLAHIHQAKLHEYSPPQIKLAITGNGRASKEDVALMVERILKQKIVSKTLDDEIDAIAIALTHSANKKNSLVLQGLL